MDSAAELGAASNKQRSHEQESDYEKPEASIHSNPEGLSQAQLDEIAARGHAATDQYGNPLVQFDPKVEARIRRKIDLCIVPTVALLYLFCFIDRANIGNARLAGLEKELKLVHYDYNILLTAFYIAYILFEIPCTLTCKIIGPGWFLPITSLGFGALSFATAYVNTKGQAAGVRFVLGIFEAGMLPGIAYYMSRWYRKSELVFRLSLYLVMAPLAGAVGGLLASAILKHESIAGLSGWRMIFWVEGLITMLISLISFLTLTDRPATARWLTQEEKDVAIARVKSENVGTTEVLDKLDMAKILRGIRNPNTLFVAGIFLLDNITVQGLAFFLPTIVATIYPTSSTVHKQLMTTPPYFVGAVFVVLIPYLSSRFNKRVIWFIPSALGMMLGYAIFVGTDVVDKKARYGATFIIGICAFQFGAFSNAQISANCLADSARSSAIGFNVMMGNIGGLISTWSFLSSDAPNYRNGNSLNLGTSTGILLLSCGLYYYHIRDNKRREQLDVTQELAGMTEKQIQDLDYLHPAFRWKS